VSAHPEHWTLASADQHALIVGRKDTVHLDSAVDAACVDGVTVKDADGKTLDAAWKSAKPNEIQIDMPLDNEQAGTVSLQVKQVGLEKPDQVPLHTYSEAGRLDSFKIYAGDHQGVLKGTRLDEVATMAVNNIAFSPAAPLTHTNSEDSLLFAAPESASSNFHPDDKAAVKVTLKDGRELDLDATVQSPRPSVKLLNKSVHVDGPASAVQLGSQDELPDHAKLTFFVQAPEAFPRGQRIEVASSDNSFSTVLRVGEGGIVLQDNKTALVTLDPAKAFGGSAFGPIRFRPVSAEGVQGDWQPLATLVRVPVLKELLCAEGAPLCKLVGTDLFLLQQVGIDAQLANAVTVPEGFGDTTLNVPRPNGTLYLKLRDDPSVVNTAVLPVTPEPSQSAAVAPLADPAKAAPAAQPESKPSQQTTPARWLYTALLETQELNVIATLKLERQSGRIPREGAALRATDYGAPAGAGAQGCPEVEETIKWSRPFFEYRGAFSATCRRSRSTAASASGARRSALCCVRPRFCGGRHGLARPHHQPERSTLRQAAARLDPPGCILSWTAASIRARSRPDAR
jgi:hypothetical protein